MYTYLIFLLVQQFFLWTTAWLLLNFTDLSLTLWVNRALTPNQLIFAKIITYLGDGITIGGIIVASFAAIIIRFKKYKVTAATASKQLFYSVALLYSYIATSVVIHIMKFCFGRTRPRYLLQDNHHNFYNFDFTFQYHSFPSGHSAVAFAFFIIIAKIWPRYKIHCWLLAALIGLSRVVLCKHFLSDVLVGSYYGALIAIIVFKSDIVKKHTQIIANYFGIVCKK